MEYCEGGDMFHLVVRSRGLPEDDARWYFQQLVIAIDYCHKAVRITGRLRHTQQHNRCNAFYLPAHSVLVSEAYTC